MLTFILAVAQVASGVAPPAFSFRGITAGVPVSSTSLSGCAQGNSGIKMCGRNDDTLAGVRAKVLTFFHDAKLTAVLVDGRQSDYRTLWQAARATYGAPCRQSSERRTNAAGTAFQNPMTTWCFATGKLTMREYGRHVEGAELYYADEANAGPRAAVNAGS